ncbi:hypothetical protein ACLOJK_001326 [Asimina triloba]
MLLSSLKKEAVGSIIFAAPRCSDLPELMQVHNLFTTKYGKEFVSAASELRPDSSVNRDVIEKLSVKAPSVNEKLKILKEIAKEYNLEWDSTSTEEEFSKKHEDLLDGSTQISYRAADLQARSAESPIRSTPVSHPPTQNLVVKQVQGPTLVAKAVAFSNKPSSADIDDRNQVRAIDRWNESHSDQKTEISSTSSSTNILERARAAIASAERASAAARAAAELAKVRLGCQPQNSTVSSSEAAGTASLTNGSKLRMKKSRGASYDFNGRPPSEVNHPPADSHTLCFSTYTTDGRKSQGYSPHLYLSLSHLLLPREQNVFEEGEKVEAAEEKSVRMRAVNEELNKLVREDLTHAPARRRLRESFKETQLGIDHCLLKASYPGVKMKEVRYSYEVNSRGLEIFTKSWLPEASPLKAIVCHCHDYGDTCTFFFEGIAKKLASSGYGVFSMDYPGMGLSEGLHGYIPSFEKIVDDAVEHFSKVKEEMAHVGFSEDQIAFIRGFKCIMRYSISL